MSVASDPDDECCEYDVDCDDTDDGVPDKYSRSM